MWASIHNTVPWRCGGRNWKHGRTVHSGRTFAGSVHRMVARAQRKDRVSNMITPCISACRVLWRTMCRLKTQNWAGTETRNWSCMCCHFSRYNGRVMSLYCTLLSTVYWNLWWTFRTFETPRRAAQQWLSICPLNVLTYRLMNCV